MFEGRSKVFPRVFQSLRVLKYVKSISINIYIYYTKYYLVFLHFFPLFLLGHHLLNASPATKTDQIVIGDATASRAGVGFYAGDGVGGLFSFREGAGLDLHIHEII